MLATRGQHAEVRVGGGVRGLAGIAEQAGRAAEQHEGVERAVAERRLEVARARDLVHVSGWARVRHFVHEGGSRLPEDRQAVTSPAGRNRAGSITAAC